MTSVAGCRITTEHSIDSAHPAAHRGGTFTLKDTGWVEAATRRKGKAKSKAPRFHKPKAWATQRRFSELRRGHPPAAPLYFREICCSDILSSARMSTSFNNKSGPPVLQGGHPGMKECGLQNAEIAGRLGTTANTVNVAVHSLKHKKKTPSKSKPKKTARRVR